MHELQRDRRLGLQQVRLTSDLGVSDRKTWSLTERLHYDGQMVVVTQYAMLKSISHQYGNTIKVLTVISQEPIEAFWCFHAFTRFGRSYSVAVRTRKRGAD